MTIDTRALKESLPAKRWFGGKGRAIDRVEVVDRAIIEDGAPSLVLALISVHFTDGAADLYSLPLLVSEDGYAVDAIEDAGRLAIFGELMAHGLTIKGDTGAFHFGGPGLDPLAPPGGSVRAVTAEQSNTSVIFDDTVILKLFRRVAVGANPDLELNRLLTNEGFEHVPPQVGEILYEGTIDDEEEVEVDIAIAQRFVADAVEGWEEVRSRLGALYDEIHDQDANEDILWLTEERSAEVLDAIEELGNVTAALHVALARDELEPDVAPEQITDTDLSDWADAASIALERLRADGIGEIEPHAAALHERIDQLREVTDPGAKTRIHGDYHLGQVMDSPRGWLIIDLEGEPARSLEERRAKQSPLRDVAGMLRSFNYAALSALFDRAEPGSDEWSRLEPWANAWEELARDRFLSAYLATSHEGRFRPHDREDLAVMVDVFEVDKALYELRYELGHRPDWVRIPLRGIERVALRSQR